MFKLPDLNMDNMIKTKVSFRLPDTIHPPKGKLKWFIWAFFGNEKDGYIGDTVFNPEQKDTFSIRLKWWLRNPCHNFTWYVIGLAHRHIAHINEFSQEQPGWNRAYTCLYGDYMTDAHKAKKYKFIHYIGKKREFYIGYRGTGAFGIKFRKTT